MWFFENDPQHVNKQKHRGEGPHDSGRPHSHKVDISGQISWFASKESNIRDHNEKQEYQYTGKDGLEDDRIGGNPVAVQPAHSRGEPLVDTSDQEEARIGVVINNTCNNK